jgi:hypothetical protein
MTIWPSFALAVIAGLLAVHPDPRLAVGPALLCLVFLVWEVVGAIDRLNKR